MGRGKSIFRQTDVTRLLKAARAAGVKVRVEIEPGKITAIPMKDVVDQTNTDAEVEKWVGKHVRKS